jgi:hypothetical protein
VKGGVQWIAAAALAATASGRAQQPPVPTPAPAQPAAAKEANAAAIYREAVAALRRAFAIGESQQYVELPALENEDDPTQWRFAKAEWGEPVAEAGTALAMFAAASRLPACDFGAGAERFDCGRDDVAMLLYGLAKLTTASGWHALADGSTDGAAQHAITVLRHSVHVGRQPSVLAAMLALHDEQAGLALLREALTAPGAAAAREVVRRELDQHAERRTDRARVLASQRAELVRRLATIAEVTKPPADPARESAADRVVRERGAAIRERVLGLADEWIAPLAKASDAEIDPALAALKRSTRQLMKTQTAKELERRLRQLEPAAAVEAVATQLALMLVPSLDDPLRRERDARAQLQRLRASLADPPAANDKR